MTGFKKVFGNFGEKAEKWQLTDLKNEKTS